MTPVKQLILALEYIAEPKKGRRGGMSRLGRISVIKPGVNDLLDLARKAFFEYEEDCHHSKSSPNVLVSSNSHECHQSQAWSLVCGHQVMSRGRDLCHIRARGIHLQSSSLFWSSSTLDVKGSSHAEPASFGEAHHRVAGKVRFAYLVG